jgi:8-oxo-dGTP diphosphatase
MRPPGVRLAGHWEFPGGKMETQETPEACLKREMREETGLDVEIVSALEPITQRDDDITVVLHPFICHTAGGTAPPPVIPLRANTLFRWVSVAELADYRFPIANAPLLLRLRMLLALDA